MTSKRNPAIDGLRGIAVLSVVLYHFGFSFFSGGFVGVDVFFVISGFLITGIITEGMQSGTFSVAAFYVRRVRRILPALLAMLSASAAAAYLVMLPGQLIEFAQSLLSSLFSVSNFYFEPRSGYFDGASGLRPLLHTWSLGIEEQFYLLFPLALLALRKAGRISVFISIAAVAGLAGSIATFHYLGSNAAFYLTYARIWEILIGAALSLHAIPRFKSNASREMLSWAGFALIAAAICKAFSMPNEIAVLLACFGSAAVILSCRSESTSLTRALSVKPLTFVGIISYSLYLWHWPILVFYRIEPSTSTAISPAEKLALIAASLLLACLSWRLVEEPFRKKMPQRKALAAIAAWFLIVLAAGTFIIHSAGMPDRFSGIAYRMATYMDMDKNGKRVSKGTCFLYDKLAYDKFNIDECLAYDPSKPNYLLIGDSHAARIYNALSSALPGANIMQLASTQCDVDFAPSEAGNACSKLEEYVDKSLLPSRRIDRIFVSRLWSYAGIRAEKDILAWADKKGVPVTVFGLMPTYEKPLPALLAYSIMRNDPALVAARTLTQRGDLEKRLKAAVYEPHSYVSMWNEICPPGKDCISLTPDGFPLMSDNNHLTKPGSLYLVEGLVQKGLLKF